MSKFVSRFMKDEYGATANEYGLIAALIAVAAITAMNGTTSGAQGSMFMRGGGGNAAALCFRYEEESAMPNLIRRFIADQSGATAVEYAVIVTLLSVVIAAAITSLGKQMYNLIGNATAAIH